MRAELYILFALMAFWFTGCTPRLTQVFPGPDPRSLGQDKRPAILFVHGYYGSALDDPETGERVFARPSQALFQKLPVALDSAALGARPSKELRVEGVFGSVVVIPYFYEMPVYRPFLDDLRKDSSVQVIPYAYDWRKDLFGAVQGLDALVKKLKASGVPKVTLIAHSMGGLVASYYLGYGAQNPATAKLNWEGTNSVQKAVFFGTPFRGAVSILRNMQSGTGYPWNQDFLEPATVSSFPASFSLVPMQGDSFVGEEGAFIPLDLTQPSTWRDWQLSYYHLQAPTLEIAQNRATFLEKQVANATRWARLLHFEGKAPPARLKVLNVIGSGTRTLAKGFANFPTHEIYFRKDEMRRVGKDISNLEEDGDGSVPVSSADLPDAFDANARVLSTTRTHGELFLDPKIQKEYALFLSQP